MRLHPKDPGKKKRQSSAIASAGAVRSQGVVCCHGPGFGASGTDDLGGRRGRFLVLLSGVVEQSNTLRK